MAVPGLQTEDPGTCGKPHLAQERLYVYRMVPVSAGKSLEKDGSETQSLSPEGFLNLCHSTSVFNLCHPSKHRSPHAG